jgi:malonyl-CoA decarboxylase
MSAVRQLSESSLHRWFGLLVTRYSHDPRTVRRCAEAYHADPSAATLLPLQQSVESPRQELFNRLSLAPGGAAALVELRGGLLRGLAAHPEWASIDADLVRLLRAWFHPGFLELRRLDWQTAPAILEKLIAYEAVHPIGDWRELRRRLESDRRCFGLFHPAMPDTPLIFTELALTSGLSANVQELLEPRSPIIDPVKCDCATFYSISNCHDGLRNIPFGNTLIRRVVSVLERELPGIRTFATLSPVPGFRPWLTAAVERGAVPRELTVGLDDSQWVADRSRDAALERTLKLLCARYLLQEKSGTEPCDPVARFHLGNGARLHRLNWLGDTSPSGLRRSAGFTANYLYRLDQIDKNHRAYVRHGRVAASRSVEKLAASLGPLLTPTR